VERLGGEDRGRTASVRQVAAASLLGTTIEWYDFFIYVTAASFAFNVLFFPESEPLTGTLLALGTNAVGFVARPLGGRSSATSGIASGASPCLSRRFC
jgi:MHS family shikimate/dehydroshikimate transporter-like MFS transporter